MNVHLKTDERKENISDYPWLTELPDGLIDGMPHGIIVIDGSLFTACQMQNDNLLLERLQYHGDITEGKETDAEREIVCPYCGYRERNSWEATCSEDERVCMSCGATFSMERELIVTYSTKPVSPPEITRIWKESPQIVFDITNFFKKYENELTNGNFESLMYVSDLIGNFTDYNREKFDELQGDIRRTYGRIPAAKKEGSRLIGLIEEIAEEQKNLFLGHLPEPDKTAARYVKE